VVINAQKDYHHQYPVMQEVISLVCAMIVVLIVRHAIIVRRPLHCHWIVLLVHIAQPKQNLPNSINVKMAHLAMLQICKQLTNVIIVCLVPIVSVVG
jgi:hypothetical protein